MANSTEEFFARLGLRGHIPMLKRATGTVRVELVRGTCTEHWYVRMDRGDVTVSRENIEADAVMRSSRELFDRAVCGEESLMSALLRGEVSTEGEVALLVQLERLLPGPPGSREPGPVHVTGERPAAAGRRHG